MTSSPTSDDSRCLGRTLADVQDIEGLVGMPPGRHLDGPVLTSALNINSNVVGAPPQEDSKSAQACDRQNLTATLDGTQD